MRFDSADAFDPDVDEAPVDDPSSSEAAALAAINASWQDETERTDVMQPRHLASHFATAARTERQEDATSRHVSPPARSAEDPHWDDEAELTNALDFEHLAPWHSDASDGDPAWEVAVTNRLDPVPAADGGRRDEPSIRFDLSNERSSVDDLVSPVELTPPPRRPISSVRALSFAADLTPTPGLLEVSPWPSRPRRELDSGRTTQRPARPLARTSSAPHAQREQSSAQPAYESQAVRKSQVARAQGERSIAQPAVELPPVFAAPRTQRPSTAAVRPRAVFSQPPTAANRTSPAPLPARPPSVPPVWIAQSRAPTPMFNPPPSAASLPDFDLPVRRSAATSSWLWLSAGAMVAVVVAFGFRLWTEVTADLQAAPEVAISAATAPSHPEATGFSITTRPAGAQVQVDGKATGLITPARVRQLTPGLHAIDLKLPGYYDTSLPAVLQDGTTLELAEVELRPLAAAEPPAVATQPSGSERKLRASKSRRYRARRHAKQEISSIETTPLGSAPAALEAPLEAEPAPMADASGEGVLQINSRPWARVLVDDKFVGNTPQRALRLPAGRHVVRLVNEPLNMSKTFTVEIRDGETVTKVETLNEQPAQSGVRSVHSGESAVAQVLPLRIDP